jgi:hypothetical protein
MLKSVLHKDENLNEVCQPKTNYPKEREKINEKE